MAKKKDKTGWVKFFLGTPQRFLGTMAGIGVAICLISPETFARALQASVGAILTAIGPLIGPALAVLIVLAGLKMMFRVGSKS